MGGLTGDEVAGVRGGGDETTPSSPSATFSSCSATAARSLEAAVGFPAYGSFVSASLLVAPDHANLIVYLTNEGVFPSTCTYLGQTR